MKTNLTVYQSAELIGWGINPERASIKMPVDAPYWTSGIVLVPVFNIGDLFAMLPKRINLPGFISPMSVTWYDGYWRVKYAGVLSFEDMELCDALFRMMIELIKNKYVNPSEL